MISFVPLLMIAGFGYVIYRWCLPTGAHAVSRKNGTREKEVASNPAGVRVPREKEADKHVAAVAGVGASF